MIYLDNASTTQIHPQVADTMLSILKNHFGNPSSTHGAGRDAAKILRESRESIANILDVPSSSITFTSGATEANNLALFGYALANVEHGRHIVTTSIEHPSVLKPLQYLEERFGFEITTVTPDAEGMITCERILSAIQENTLLVSVMMANNETGQLLPVEEIGAALKNSDIAFHVDATQAVGKIPVFPKKIEADFLSASAHKFHGPKGVGFLYHLENTKFDATLHGGGQEVHKRAGTENLIGIAGMAKALELATSAQADNFQKVTQLHDLILDGLQEVNFYENRFGQSLPHVLNLGFPAHRNDLLLTKLDLAGIAVSTGSACSAGVVELSHVLEAVYGQESKKLKENLRISLSEFNTTEEINTLISTLKGLL